MAGNRFTKKLQAIKSRMMMDDVPVDSSRRKLFTLPPEETSQSLPATKQTSKESPLTQLANKPVDRREFLKQAGQSAKSAAVRGILPELGKLVEMPIEKALPQPTDFGIAETKLKDALATHIAEISGDYEDLIPTAYGIIKHYIDTSKFKPSELKKLDKLSDLAEEGNYNAAVKLEEALYDMIDNIKPGSALDVLDEVLSPYRGESFHASEIADILNSNEDIPHDLIHDYLDTHHPGYDEEAIKRFLDNPGAYIM